MKRVFYHFASYVMLFSMTILLTACPEPDKEEELELDDPHQNITIELLDIPFEMVYVSGGTFMMGATAEQVGDARESEYPVHKVTLSDYYIGKTEVTQELWETVMGYNPSSEYFIGDNLPVNDVSWYDCQEFIKKLNKLTGMTFRLPTEAEWEYAARGGSKSKGYKYSGSNNIDKVAWYDVNSSTISKVGAKQPNELGIYDMSGNVLEWCDDYFYLYSSEDQIDPRCSSSIESDFRVCRGGTWNGYARYCRVSNRAENDPEEGLASFGFRLVYKP